jgi:hypothetical protein
VCHREEAQAKEEMATKAQKEDLERVMTLVAADIVCKEAELAALSKETAELDRIVEEQTKLQEEIEGQMGMAKNEMKWAEQAKDEAIRRRKMEELKLEALKAEYGQVRTRQERSRKKGS